MANQCYFNGDFYQCATATSAGESPSTAPAKWRRIQIPKRFRRVLARLTYGHLLELDGQKDKSMAELNSARDDLASLVQEALSAEHSLDRPEVRRY